jgi:hypothetical protein
VLYTVTLIRVLSGSKLKSVILLVSVLLIGNMCYAGNAVCNY